MHFCHALAIASVRNGVASDSRYSCSRPARGTIRSPELERARARGLVALAGRLRLKARQAMAARMRARGDQKPAGERSAERCASTLPGGREYGVRNYAREPTTVARGDGLINCALR
eukprot:6214421-Pleurochrysis_carterae.AAC.3